MSSHYVYVQCENCEKTESLYTGNLDTDNFDFEDWEGEFIKVRQCKECKSKDKS